MHKKHIGPKQHGRDGITCQNNLSFTDAYFVCERKGEKNDAHARKKDANIEKVTFWCVQKEHNGMKTHGWVRIQCQNNSIFTDGCVLC